MADLPNGVAKTLLCDEKIFTLSNFFAGEECDGLVKIAEAHGFKDSAPSGGGHGRTGKEDPRTSQFCVLNDEGYAHMLWEKVKEFLPPDLSHLSTSAYINNDKIADVVYVGDLFGNLWKFDISSSNTSQWDSAFTQGGNPSPIFVAFDANNNHQTITSRPLVSRNPGLVGTFNVYSGTGKYIETADKTDMSIQSFYMIKDAGTAISARSELLQQSILDEGPVTLADSSTIDYRVTSQNTMTDSHNGWYMDLIYNNNAEGERHISEPIIRNGKVVFTTLIPSDDPCDYGGTGWLMEFNAKDGVRIK